MLHLCDNQALLIAVKRWVGEGGKMSEAKVAFIIAQKEIM
jgi:hypothetical protein